MDQLEHFGQECSSSSGSQKPRGFFLSWASSIPGAPPDTPKSKSNAIPLPPRTKPPCIASPLQKMTAGRCKITIGVFMFSRREARGCGCNVYIFRHTFHPQRASTVGSSFYLHFATPHPQSTPLGRITSKCSLHVVRLSAQLLLVREVHLFLLFCRFVMSFQDLFLRSVSVVGVDGIRLPPVLCY